MKNLQELRESRAAQVKALETLIEKTKDRSMTADENAEFDLIEAEIEQIDADITRAEAAERIRLSKAKDASGKKSQEAKVMERHSLGRAVNALMTNRALDGAEAEIHAEAEREAREAGVSISGVGLPSWAIRFDAEKRTDWNVTTSADGGYTVQTDVQPIVEALRPVSILSQMGINVMSGLRGNLLFPTDTAGSGAWEGEVDANANYSPTIGTVSSSPKRFGAVATMSKQLMAQSTSISDAYIRRQLELTIGTAIDQVGIEGGGSNEPTGIIGNSSVTVLNAGTASATGVNANGAALTWDDIVALWNDVVGANSTMVRPAFLTNNRVIAKGSATPRQSSGVEGNFIFNESMTAYGYPVMHSTNVPGDITKGSSTTLNALIFGDFSQLTLAQWGGLDLVVDPYSAATTAQIKIIANIWVDFIITRPQAFAVIKDILTTGY